MASIPADSKAFLKPFEGTDVTCLILDVVAWFGADEIVSILNQNLCTAIKNLPSSQKAMWKQLEPQVHSEKQFITSLGVRILIGRIDSVVPQPPLSCHASYYNNTLIEPYPSTSTRFDLSRSLHNLGNIFINEAIYDVRAYPQLDENNVKINKIYNILLKRNTP
ncbi:PEP [Choristoneura occidentalis granulovirus]|uniref:PEP n=1 Tax=Choristoneura occidentalis granulovirus TaxID=364745 RepID=Q1A4S9_9BBAC|nr:PEP [Choristoneura fumiferana granulovirus]ABC61151.1 PEP [Choristoneura fumiferana granulovirus]